MNKEKTWKLNCHMSTPWLCISEEESEEGFEVEVGGKYLYILKSKATINVIRKMCDWMEKRL